MGFIDSHAHIYTGAFDNDRIEAIDRAKKAGVEVIIMPNIDVESIELMNACAKQFENYAFPAMGLHPTEVKEDFQQLLQPIRDELFKGNYIAIGECGLDYYWDKTHIAQQKEVFIEHLNWSKQLQLPLIIHTRDSIDDTLEILSFPEYKGVKAVMHCFSGDYIQAKKAIDLGHKLGIGGVITFKNNLLATYINQLPPENIMLETDAPFLSPVPYRGKRNEPAYLPLVFETVCSILKKDKELLENILLESTKKFFQLKKLGNSL